MAYRAAFGGSLAGPRYLDAHHAGRLQPDSLQRYRAAGLPFAEWLRNHNLQPVYASEWDDLLVEYKNSTPQISRSKFGQLIASVEFFFPSFQRAVGLVQSGGQRLGVPERH